MIESAAIVAFHYGTFRSFEEAILPLGPLTLLVGLNASGKSNAREGVQLLSWMARGRRLDDILQSARDAEAAVRGHYGDLGYRGASTFRLGCSVVLVEDSAPIELRWTIDLRIDGSGLRVHREELAEATGRGWFWIDEAAQGVGHDVSVGYQKFDMPRPVQLPFTRCTDLLPALNQLVSPAAFRERDAKDGARIAAAAESIRAQLDSIVLLDPNPPRMRGPSAIGEPMLRPDGSNLSGVLHGLCADPGTKAEVLSFVRSLPEQAIDDLQFLPGLPGQVIVQAREGFGEKVLRDASLLSDGTLRVLAVAAALLSAPAGGTVIIEEVDNGIHPSRATELMANMFRLATRRGLRVLITSHNPALADALPLEALRDVVVCHRSPAGGESRLTRLGELPEAMLATASSSLGRLMTTGELQREVVDIRPDAERVQDAMAAIREIFGQETAP